MSFEKSLDNYITHRSNNLYTGYVGLIHSIWFQNFETVEWWIREQMEEPALAEVSVSTDGYEGIPSHIHACGYARQLLSCIYRCVRGIGRAAF